MTRQDQIIKWFCYALGLVFVWVPDAYLLGRYPMLGVVPNLLPLAVVAVAAMEGAKAGAGFGMAVGLLWAVGYPEGNGILVIGMTLAGMLAGTVTQYALRQNFFGYLICSAAVLAALGLIQTLWCVLGRLAPVEIILVTAGKEALVTLLWTPAVYLIFRFIYRRVGGEKLA